jgi:hypothetical protein
MIMVLCSMVVTNNLPKDLEKNRPKAESDLIVFRSSGCMRAYGADIFTQQCYKYTKQTICMTNLHLVLFPYKIVSFRVSQSDVT